MDRFVEPLDRCVFHPSRTVVGICSSCLRERLVSLAKANYEQHRWEIVYTPDPSSWSYLRFKGNNHDDVQGIRDLDPIARTKTQNYDGSDKKKGRKLNFPGLRSFLGFLKKSDCRNDVSVRGRLENRFQRRQDRSEDVQDSWVSSVRTKIGCPSSTRHSVSECKSFARPGSKGPVLRRSMSDNNEREMLRTHEKIMEDAIDSDIKKKLPNNCENDEGKLIHVTDSLARCRSQRVKGRTRDWPEIKDSKVGTVRNNYLPTNKTSKSMNYNFYYSGHERRQGGRSDLG